MKSNNKKQKRPVPQPKFFALLDGRLEDALLIYSNIIDETIEVDPALDAMTERGITFIPFPLQPPYEEGLAEIEHALLKKGVVIRRRDGKVVAEPKSGPTKAKGFRRPSPKPAHEPHSQVIDNQRSDILAVQGRKARNCSGSSLHDVVLLVPADCVNKYASSRWPGEQARKRRPDGAIELHLQVPNLDPVVTWLGGTLYEVRPVSPAGLFELLNEVFREMEENIRKMRERESDGGFSE